MDLKGKLNQAAKNRLKLHPGRTLIPLQPFFESGSTQPSATTRKRKRAKRGPKSARKPKDSEIGTPDKDPSKTKTETVTETEIIYYSNEPVENPVITKDTKFIKMLQELLNVVTNNFKPCRISSVFNTYVLDMNCFPRHTYKFRDLPQRRYNPFFIIIIIDASISSNFFIYRRMIPISSKANGRYLNSLFENLNITFWYRNMECVIKVTNINVVAWEIIPVIDENNSLTPDLCYICFERNANCIIENCNHTICTTCSSKLMEFVKRDCPFCRQNISKITHYV